MIFFKSQKKITTNEDYHIHHGYPLEMKETKELPR
jgi:hypothetical protein